MIQAFGLSKRYGAKIAVDNLSFQVRPGAVTGFLGPNGSGKSTTMRMILGLDTPTAGQVTVGGMPYRHLPNAPRRVGALLDAKAVHGGRSARQHLLCLAQLAGIPARRVDEVLGVVGLQEVANRRSKGFSLGMGQRLGIAGALLGDPEVLLFDEPVNGLDPEGIHWVRHLMRTLAAEGRTVFVSSHLMSEMALTADHLIVIGRGQLLADMTVKDFIARHSPGYAVVRTPQEGEQPQMLAKALTAAGATVQAEQDGALRVTGLPLPRISDVAHEADVRLWELSPHQASLEEAYMRLTAGVVDYRSTQDPRQGLQAAAQGYAAGPGQGHPPAWPQQQAWGQPQPGAAQPQLAPPPQGFGAPPVLPPPALAQVAAPPAAAAIPPVPPAPAAPVPAAPAPAPPAPVPAAPVSAAPAPAPLAPVPAAAPTDKSVAPAAPAQPEAAAPAAPTEPTAPAQPTAASHSQDA